MEITNADTARFRDALTPSGAAPLPDEAVRTLAQFFCALVVMLVADLSNDGAEPVDNSPR